MHEVQHRWALAHIVCAKHNTVCRRQHRFVSAKRNDVFALRKMMFATALQNDVVSLRTQTQKEKAHRVVCFFFLGVLNLVTQIKYT